MEETEDKYLKSKMKVAHVCHQVASLSRSQSSHVLTGSVATVADRLSVDDTSSSSLEVTFEDRALWRDSFAILHEFYQSGTFCDVEIQVGSRRVNCHRLVLACFSQYFR